MLLTAELSLHTKDMVLVSLRKVVDFKFCQHACLCEGVRSPGLELQTGVSCHVGDLGIEARSSGRAASECS